MVEDILELSWQWAAATALCCKRVALAMSNSSQLTVTAYITGSHFALTLVSLADPMDCRSAMAGSLSPIPFCRFSGVICMLHEQTTT
jgi:hypothetical protein